MRHLLLLLLLLGLGVWLAFRHPEALVKIIEDMPISPAEEAQLLRRLPKASEIAPTQVEISGQVVLPLQWLMGIPFVPVWIEGKQHLLQFDPGSRYTHLYPALARRLSGITLISKEAVGEAPAGKFRFHQAQIQEMRLGSARIYNDIVAIPLLKTSVRLFGLLTIYEYPGLLGLRTLRPFLVTIHLSGSRVILQPKGSPPPEGAVAIPFELRPQLEGYDQNLVLVAHLNGQGPFRFVLDPGAPTTGVAPRVAQQLGFDPQQPFRLTIEVASQKIAEGLGARAIPFFLEEAKMEDGTVIDGLLGRNWLRRWVVTIDFERQQIYLIPARGQ